MVTVRMLVLALAGVMVFAFGVASGMEPVAYANEGCYQLQGTEPWNIKDYQCLPPVSLSWQTIYYEDIYPLGCEPYGASNPAYYLEIDITVCGHTNPAQTGEVRGYDGPGGNLLYSTDFDEEDNNVVFTDCFESCGWPTYWEVEIDDTEIGLDEVEYMVGCCSCEQESEACSR